ncbi:MAG: AAA family ATPase, partial [Cyanobacteria bacterium P01_C01_bin.72]
MKTNPGGKIAPNEVIGRDLLIRELWDRLEQQSIIISAERRMGKTSVIRKMEYEPPAGKLAIFRDLEGIESPVEFVEAVWRDVEAYLSTAQKATESVKQFLNQFKGIEISGFKIPEVITTQWKVLLAKIIEDLVANQDKQVILLWDEMPYMLNKMPDKEAMEVLDVLRSLRQTYPKIRMVFTGSIGLHHIVNQLRQQGYSNEPTNDMYPVDIKPLALKDATNLSRLLIVGENIAIADQNIPEVIAKSVGCIPFYIHHLISSLKFANDTLDLASVEDKVIESIINPQNPWKMEHYRERIDIQTKNTYSFRY